MGYGQPKKEFDLKSDALSFDVKAPKDVKENQFVLVTDNYSLVSEMKPEKKQLIIGDAVELSVTQKAHDVPPLGRVSRWLTLFWSEMNCARQEILGLAIK